MMTERRHNIFTALQMQMSLQKLHIPTMTRYRWNMKKNVPTGAEKITYQVRILDYLIKNPFFSPVEEPYEVVSDVSQFHFTDNFYLPVYLVRQTCVGYKNEQKTYTEKEAKRLASENLKKYLDDLEEKGIQITEKNCYYRENEEKTMW